MSKQNNRKHVKSGSKKTVQGKGHAVSVKTQNIVSQTGNKLSGRRMRLILACFVAVFGILLYANTIGHDYTLDDDPAISKNKLTTQGMSAIPKMMRTAYWYGFIETDAMAYRPLSLIMFAVEWQFFPKNPQVSHLVNVLLYSLTGFIMFLALCSLFKSPSDILPFVAALLFIAHPVHTEVVASIKSRDEILALLFIISSLYFLLEYLDKNSMSNLLLSLTCYALALLSKENAVTYMGVVPMVLFFKKTPLRKAIILASFFIVLAGMYVAVRSEILGGLTTQRTYTAVDNTLVAADNMMDRYASVFSILGRYLLLLIFPHSLSYDYSFRQIPVVSWSDYRAIISLLVYFAAGIYALKGLNKRTPVVFGIFFYFITFSVVSNLLVLIGSTMGERFMYIPSLGFCLVLASFIAHYVKAVAYRVPDFLKQNKNVLLILLPLLSFYSFKTVTRNMEWKNNEVLFAADVRKSSNSARAHHNYASMLLLDKVPKEKNKEEKKLLLREAISEFEKAVKIFPEYSDAYVNMGLTYTALGDTVKALEAYETAKRYHATDANIYALAGNLYGMQGQFDKAVQYLQMAISIKPSLEEAYKNLGFLYGKYGMFDKAIEMLNKAIALNPDYAEAYNYLGNTYAGKQDFTKAIENYRKAIDSYDKYSEAYTNLGVTYGILKQYDQAIDYFLKAASYDSANAGIFQYIGVTYQFKGDSLNAQRYFMRSAQIQSEQNNN